VVNFDPETKTSIRAHPSGLARMALGPGRGLRRSDLFRTETVLFEMHYGGGRGILAGGVFWTGGFARELTAGPITAGLVGCCVFDHRILTRTISCPCARNRADQAVASGRRVPNKAHRAGRRLCPWLGGEVGMVLFKNFYTTARIVVSGCGGGCGRLIPADAGLRLVPCRKKGPVGTFAWKSLGRTAGAGPTLKTAASSIHGRRAIAPPRI